MRSRGLEKLYYNKTLQFKWSQYRIKGEQYFQIIFSWAGTHLNICGGCEEGCVEVPAVMQMN